MYKYQSLGIELEKIQNKKNKQDVGEEIREIKEIKVIKEDIRGKDIREEDIRGEDIRREDIRGEEENLSKDLIKLENKIIELNSLVTEQHEQLQLITNNTAINNNNIITTSSKTLEKVEDIQTSSSLNYKYLKLLSFTFIGGSIGGGVGILIGITNYVVATSIGSGVGAVCSYYSNRGLKQ